MGKIKFAGMGVSIDYAASYLAPSGDASLQNVAPQTGPPERSVIRTPPDPLGRQAGPWIRQATAFPHPGHLKRSLPSRFTTDHGGLSIGTLFLPRIISASIHDEVRRGSAWR